MVQHGFIKKYFLILSILFSASFLWCAVDVDKSYEQKKSDADFVIFSYNRPLQLYAFLESIEKYVAGIGSIQVIYRVSDDSYEEGYKVVKKEFLFGNFF